MTQENENKYDQQDFVESQASTKSIESSAKKPTMRYFIILLGLCSLALSSMSRTIFSMSLSDMNKNPATGNSCPLPVSKPVDSLKSFKNLYEKTILISIADTKAQGKKLPNIKWSQSQERVLLAGFYSTYTLFMIVGGTISEKYGSMFVLLLSGAGCALTNILTPFTLNILYGDEGKSYPGSDQKSFGIMLILRMFLGACQAGVLPACYALINNWSTHSESLIWAPLSKVSLRMGMVLGSYIFKFTDWYIAFYITGATCGFWSVLWLLTASSKPEDSRFVSKEEVEHICKKKKQKPMKDGVESVQLKDLGDKKQKCTTNKQTTQTPWLRLVTNKSVLLLMCAKFGFNLAFDTMSQYMPMYLQNVYHNEQAAKSWKMTIISTIQLVLGVSIPFFVKTFTRKSLAAGMSLTFVRRFFQGLTMLGMSFAFFGITKSNCNSTSLEASLYAYAVMSCFSAGGDVLLPYDLTRIYPATIMGMVNSFANVGSLSSSILVSMTVGEDTADFENWNKFFLMISLIVGLTGLAFVFFVEAKPIDFDRKEQQIDVEEAVIAEEAMTSVVGEEKDDEREVEESNQL